jgi:hypothetical protein
MNALKMALVALAALGGAACTTLDGDGHPGPKAITEGHSVYVLNAATEQEARASAMSICRSRGGTAVFNGMIQYRRHHTVYPAAEFDCTN